MTLTAAQLAALVDIARDSVAAAVGGEPYHLPAELDDVLLEERAVFVTVQRHGHLRGCIGTLEPSGPLAVATADMARAAAVRDPRFDAVQPWELDDLDVSISVLSRTEPIEVHSWAALCERIRPGVDGIVIDDGLHRATFLPSVWEELPEVPEFLDRLWQKAGMVPRRWPDTMSVSRYTVQHAPHP